MKNTVLIITSGLILSLTLGVSQQNGEWKAPASADKITNPFIGNTTATVEGKKLYKQMCTVCHGNTGKGDGMGGMSLNPRPSNFTTEKFQSQTDGAIYWKLTEGRAPMASYRNILEEEQRWQLVNYMRTLKK
ncbi:MAG: cytochrome c class I [Crocinitomicaceae bacterium]|nr:cytochrome c class I [Crocinitomicaceae bacterium]|tara:strand:+ start:14320 stop:14715 length:396 start_codon:yes stop_codon:yes gene_type:complete